MTTDLIIKADDDVTLYDETGRRLAMVRLEVSCEPLSAELIKAIDDQFGPNSDFAFERLHRLTNILRLDRLIK